MTTDIDALVERLGAMVGQGGTISFTGRSTRSMGDDIDAAAQALTRLSEENARLREALAAGTRECEQCHGGGEVFGHAADCDNDLCALAGGIDDCLGRVDPCGACDGTGRAALQGDA